MLSIFLCTCWLFRFLLQKNVLFSFFAWFKIRLFGFCYWVIWVLHIFWILKLSNTWFTSIFLPFCMLAFHSFCWLFILLCQRFLIWYSPTCWFLLCVCCMLLVPYPKNHCQDQCWGDSPLHFLLTVFLIWVILSLFLSEITSKCI